MSLKESTLNELYERLWKLRAGQPYDHLSYDELDIIIEIKRREKDDRPR